MTVQVQCSEAVVQAAISQIGTVESPSGSNRQKYGEWYAMNGVAWCAIFISWCFNEGGHPLPAINSSKGYASCSSAVAWAKANGLFRPYGSGYTPKRGDIIFYSWTGGAAEHTGIELGHMNDGREHTVEGNTSGVGSQANGGEVMEKYRRGSIVGWLSTTWVDSGNPSVVAAPLHLGDKGDAVKAFQQRLNTVLGAVSLGNNVPVVVDGDFGPATAARWDEFQKFGLAMQQIAGVRGGLIVPNGEVDAVSDAVLTFWVAEANKANAIRFAQAMLNIVTPAAKLGSMAPIAVTGKIDGATFARTVEFQRFYRIMQELAGEKDPGKLIPINGNPLDPSFLSALGAWVTVTLRHP